MGVAAELLQNPAVHETIRYVGQHLETFLGGVAIGGVLTAVEFEAIVVGAHGTSSHEATDQSEMLRVVNDHVTWLVGVDNKSWSSAHVGDVEVDEEDEGIEHHGMPDGSIRHDYFVERYMRTIEANPEQYAGFPTLPPEGEEIPNLDRYANFYSSEVRRKGSFGYAIMDTVLGEEHVVPDSYTREEADQLMDFSFPRYLYGEPKRHKKGTPYPVDEVAGILLADPYSPSLERIASDAPDPYAPEQPEKRWYQRKDKLPNNGPKAIDKNNVNRFRAPSDYFRANPDKVRPMLKDIKNSAPEKLPGIATLYTTAIAGFTGYLSVKHGLSIDTIANGIVDGATAATMAFQAPIKGGKLTNGWGHAGLMRARDFLKTYRNKAYEIVPDLNGKVMTKIEKSSRIGKLILRTISKVSADEPLGQPKHHEEPGDRDYGEEDGVAGLMEAPFTTNVNLASKREHFRFGLRPGKQFGKKPGERRPDVANSIMREVIEPARIRTYYPDHWASMEAGFQDVLAA